MDKMTPLPPALQKRIKELVIKHYGEDYKSRDKAFIHGCQAMYTLMQPLVEALNDIATCIERDDESHEAHYSNYYRLKDARRTADRALASLGEMKPTHPREADV